MRSLLISFSAQTQMSMLGVLNATTSRWRGGYEAVVNKLLKAGANIKANGPLQAATAGATRAWSTR